MYEIQATSNAGLSLGLFQKIFLQEMLIQGRRIESYQNLLIKDYYRTQMDRRYYNCSKDMHPFCLIVTNVICIYFLIFKIYLYSMSI